MELFSVDALKCEWNGVRTNLLSRYFLCKMDIEIVARICMVAIEVSNVSGILRPLWGRRCIIVS
jgi:hypothetical protein